MPYLRSYGDPASRIWVICDHPFPSDVKNGYIFSGGLGFMFQNMLEEAGLRLQDCHICSIHPDTDDPKAFCGSVENNLQAYKPPFIILMNEVGVLYLKELRPREQKESYRKQLNKYVGSLLSYDKFDWPHYMIPMHGPDRCAQDWLERNVTTYIDLQKLRDELEYWRSNGTIRPLRQRQLFFRDFDLGELLSHFENFSRALYLSVDIETIYPKAKSAFHPHPGYPVTIGIAPSADLGISFNLFREDPRETRILWRALDDLLYQARIIGQNFFNFDALFKSMLGFSLQRRFFEDTLLRHHILWPELSHKLQFMTRQYTREPYYKDEGKHWSMKHLSSLKRYNCLDCCVTYEVFEGQEEEFNDRPHLRGVAA
jgi:uracil-DNA glycosylase